jgi:transcription-repair coupling factor (superfamily II helicase)
MTKLFKSTQCIIDEISAIVEPHMKFNMDDVYGDRGGIPYPQIEELSLLHYKYNGKVHFPSKNKENELISQVELLGIGEVQIHRYNGIGKFMVITLNKYNDRIINEYNSYLDYKNLNAEKINDIYHYLEEKVPEEFVGWVLYNDKRFVKN